METKWGTTSFPRLVKGDADAFLERLQSEFETSAVPGRFARLQQTYGRWGLAYLESLVRAADVLASRKAEGGGA